MVAHGMKIHAVLLQQEGIWRFYNGQGIIIVHGLTGHAGELLKEDIWGFCNG